MSTENIIIQRLINLEKLNSKDLTYIQYLYNEKVLAYIYDGMKTLNHLQWFTNLSSIEKYCTGIQIYNSILMKESDFLFKNLPYLIPCKGYFMNKYIYEKDYIRELSDVDFLCTKNKQQEIIYFMIMNNYTIAALNDEVETNIHPTKANTILFEKRKEITIKIDIQFIDESSNEYKLHQLSKKEKDPVNEFEIILYLLTIANDMKKKHKHIPSLMHRIDIYNCLKKSLISLEKIKNIIQAKQELSICNMILDLLEKDGILYD